MTDRQTIASTLNSLGAAILVADPADPKDIADLRASTESVFSDVAELDSDTGEATELVLKGLAAVSEGTVPDVVEAMDILASAVSAIGTQFDPDVEVYGEEKDAIAELERSTERLQNLLNEEREDASSSVATEEDTTAADSETSESDSVQADSDSLADAASPEPANDPPAPEHFLLSDDADMTLMNDFIAECLDRVEAAEGALLDLEGNPEHSEALNEVFRSFHTIKGTSGFMELDWIQRLAHLAENLLDRARENEIQIQGGYADLTLKSCDLLRTMLEDLRNVPPGGTLPIPPTYMQMIENLQHADDYNASAASADSPTPIQDAPVAADTTEGEQVEEVPASSTTAEPVAQDQAKGDVASPEKVTAPAQVQQKTAAPPAQAPKQASGTAETTIRVSTNRLDSLIDMAGELVIAHSMVAEDPSVADGDNARLAKNVAHSGKIIRDLQDLSMALRMIPLKGTFQKMARLVRDLGRKANVSVQFVTEGEDTEIDRNMVEKLTDPLVHMIRNSVDHGVESADVRQAAGKNPTGTVTLRAFHSAGNVVIELEDDGKGLDRERILAKAVERGLVDPGSELADPEVFALIYQPGFSTAAQVTDISGRGVGMDVVKRGIESLDGRIETASTAGQGTCITMRLPLTMAIADAMLLGVGSERYLMPTPFIVHTFRPKSGDVTTVNGRGEMIQLRGSLLPMFRLHTLFGVSDAITDTCQGLVVVVEAQGQTCAIQVDEILGQQQVVIKSLGPQFGDVSGVSGAAILGDGHVGLILDTVGILNLATQ